MRTRPNQLTSGASRLRLHGHPCTVDADGLAHATARFRCRCTSLRAGVVHRQRHSTGAFPAHAAYGRNGPASAPRAIRAKKEITVTETTYTAVVTATGEGRNGGRALSDDGLLDVTLAI